ncbi:MAG: DNA polymerase III subunit delta [Firmicutes bacterium]|nr:DNA polymerase III subunit delta [Bacillota bacterium]
MDRNHLKTLESEPLPRVLVVYGPETFWHDKLYKTLHKRASSHSLAEWNWSVFHGTKEFELEALLVELGTIPWGGAEKIVVLKDAQAVPSDIMEKLATWLEQNPNANFLAIFLDKVDKRWKYLKILRQFALEIECKPLEEAALARYVQDYCTEQGKKMTMDTVEVFLARVGNNLQVVHNELDKLLALSTDWEEITAGHVRAITSLWPGQIENHTVFHMTDYIVQKKRHEALEVLNLLLSSGESPLRILPLIDRELRLLLAAKTSAGNLEQTAQQMGENSAFALKKLRTQARKYDLDEIFAGFAAVVHADRELKLGVPGPEVLTDLIIKLT